MEVRKSTTCPRSTRSATLPSAPPDQAVAHRFETWPLLAQHAPQPSKTARPSVMKNALPATSVRQKAECRTRIQDMNEVEKRGDFDLLTVGKRADDGELRVDRS
jgi:hypothetical protein